MCHFMVPNAQGLLWLSNPTQVMQHYVIKSVSDLQHDGGFLRVLHQ